MQHNSAIANTLLVETSWEVCNKIGGIYTVLTTKANSLENAPHITPVFIGPDVWDDAHKCPVFLPNKSLMRGWTSTLDLPYGISVRVGRWDIPGKPVAVLVKFDGLYAIKNQTYSRMWQRFGVDSLHAYGDYDEGCAFAVAAAIVTESIALYYRNKYDRVVALFNEWTTAMGLLYIKDTQPWIDTVFTTHATSIGRSICGNNKPLYTYLSGYNGTQMARELNMEAKHSLERAAAHNADCFTTVSDVTAAECTRLLERTPHIVTPNGFEPDFVPVGKAYDDCRAKSRRRLLDVASALTGVQYGDDTFIVLTSGRCEYRNKGIDAFIDSLNVLRSRSVDRPVLAFVMVPAWVKEPRHDLRSALDDRRRQQLPVPYMTHTLHNPDQDPIVAHIQRVGSAGGNVNIIYTPCYLNGNDGIFDMPYYDLLCGFDATVFASYYEPWGYTPLESVAFGVPTITTSLSGFGRWVLANFDNSFEACGVRVEPRDDTNYDTLVQVIASDLQSLMTAPVALAAIIKQSAYATADAARWQNFVKYYLQAFDIAHSNNNAANQQ